VAKNKNKKNTVAVLLYLLVAPVAIFLVSLLVLPLQSDDRFTAVQLGVMVFVLLSTALAMYRIFDIYPMDYLFWKNILKRRWLYWFVFCLGLLSCLGICFGVFVFPNWWIVILGGMYIGLVSALCQKGTKRGNLVRSPSVLSYKMLYQCYIENADKWEKKLQKRK